MSPISLLVAAGLLGAGVDVPGSRPVTFTRDVLPILQANCQQCHRPGEVAPMSLLTYAEARPWARAIKAAVLSQTMPPWFADPAYGHFSNDRTLRSEDVQTLVAWADGGALKGEDRDAPAPVTFRDGWNIVPDIVIEMPKPFEVPKAGTVNYKFVVVKGHFTEDLWIEAAEMRPGNPAVLHHGKVWVRPPGSRWMAEAAPGEAYETETHAAIIGRNMGTDGNDILGKFNPGLGAQSFTVEGAAKFVPKGSDLIFELHYTTMGEETSDASRVGLVVAKQPPAKRYYFNAGPAAFNLAIPAGDGNAEVVSELTVEEDAKLVYAQPHMHLRGKDFELRVISPTGESRTVLKARWDFEWQIGYEFAEPILLPKGSRLVGISHFDNSRGNRFNPDPTQTVIWGRQNWEEMSNCFIGLIVDVTTNAEKVLRASGPSLLPRGESGPTLAALEAAGSQ